MAHKLEISFSLRARGFGLPEILFDAKPPWMLGLVFLPGSYE
jgi:hypothetical protein